MPKDTRSLKVAIINRSDKRGGAAVVSFRLMQALRREGVDARMIAIENLSESDLVIPASSPLREKVSFISERLGIYISNGFSRQTLFQIDAATRGVPVHKIPFVQQADIICLNWVNQGMLSLSGIMKLVELSKPVVWTMHDQWCFTGICHHTGDCNNYLHQCGNCRLLGKKAAPHDLSFRVWNRKNRLYQQAAEGLENPITFVAVSNWLADRARQSSLLKDRMVVVIPNAFPLNEMTGLSEVNRDPYAILFGAARLDDPVKGLPLLKEALRMLRTEHPELTEKAKLITFGGFKNADSSSDFAIRHTHLGTLYRDIDIANAYRSARCVVSSSLWETLPGTLVEGQANGCIPISFNRGGQPDIITHGSTGWLADFVEGDFSGNAHRLMHGIVNILTKPHPGIEERMYESVKNRFASQAVARQYINLFRSLL